MVKSNQATPIFQCHGEDDPLVAYSFGAMTSQLIGSFNNQSQFKSYPGLGHSSCEEVCTVIACQRVAAFFLVVPHVHGENKVRTLLEKNKVR